MCSPYGTTGPRARRARVRSRRQRARRHRGADRLAGRAAAGGPRRSGLAPHRAQRRDRRAARARRPAPHRTRSDDRGRRARVRGRQPGDGRAPLHPRRRCRATAPAPRTRSRRIASSARPTAGWRADSVAIRACGTGSSTGWTRRTRSATSAARNCAIPRCRPTQREHVFDVDRAVHVHAPARRVVPRGATPPAPVGLGRGRRRGRGQPAAAGARRARTGRVRRSRGRRRRCPPMAPAARPAGRATARGRRTDRSRGRHRPSRAPAPDAIAPRTRRARRRDRARPDVGARGTVRDADPRRPRRPRRQGRVASSSGPDALLAVLAPLARRVRPRHERLLQQREPQQGQHHAQPADARRRRGVPAARRARRRGDRELQRGTRSTGSASVPTCCASAIPRLVVVSMSGLGATGPWRDYVSYADAISRAVRAHGPVRQGDGQRPTPVVHGLADIVAGHHAALATLAALAQRTRTGRGCDVDLSQLEAMAVQTGLSCSPAPRPAPHRNGGATAAPLAAPEGVYPCLGSRPLGRDHGPGRGAWRALVHGDRPARPRGGLAPRRAPRPAGAAREIDAARRGVDRAPARRARDRVPAGGGCRGG